MGSIFTRIRSAVWGEPYRARLITTDGVGIELFKVTTVKPSDSWPKVDFSRRAGEGAYEGSYSILAAFLEGCRCSGMPHSDYEQLVAALLDVSRSTKRSKINVADGHFADIGEASAAYLLSSVGIATTYVSTDTKRISSRPHMTQDMMMELFKERIMEEGHLMHKTQAACIRRAICGERVTTVIGGRVTSEVVVEDHTSWVVRAPTTHQEEYVLSNDKFEVNWLFDEPEDLTDTMLNDLADQGFKRYLPRPGIMKWMYKIRREDIAIMPSQVFKASWGALQPIILDDYLVMPYPEVKASEIYLMPADAVNCSYTKVTKDSYKFEGAKSDEISKHVPLLRSLDFDWSKRGNIKNDTEAMICGFMEPYNLLYRYQVEAAVFGEWIEEMAGLYRSNPYHDWKHAFDVFQFMYGAFTDGGSYKYFHYQDLLVLLLAAIGHDVGHPGYTNAFLINSHADLAITYNDKSPLENMHASVFFQTLRKPGLNFLSNVGKDNLKTFRTKVVDAILATDMSHHFQMVDTFSVRVSQAKQGSPFVEGSDVVDREAADQQLLLQAFMHMADVGHCCRPFEIHKFLVARLEEEFFRQGDQERKLGLPIMPMMDRTKDSAASGQSFFLNKLVMPLLKPYTFFVNEKRRKNLVDNIENNSKKWDVWVETHGKTVSAQQMLKLEGFDFTPTKTLKKQPVSGDSKMDGSRSVALHLDDDMTMSHSPAHSPRDYPPSPSKGRLISPHLSGDGTGSMGLRTSPHHSDGTGSTGLRAGRLMSPRDATTPLTKW